MNRLEETTPKIKSSESISNTKNESFLPSSPAFQTTPTEVSKTSKSESSFDFLSAFDLKTLIIFILVFVLVFSYLGINLVTILGESMEKLVKVVSPLITEILVFTGYSTGSVINTTADVVADTAKETIDIAEGAVQNVGNLLMDAGNEGKSEILNKTVQQKEKNKSSHKPPHGKGDEHSHSHNHPHPSHADSGEHGPQPDAPENTIQKPITSAKYNWCLVGEYQNKRGCMPITESDKCLSGHVFPTQKMCLNPNMAPHQ